MLDITVILRTRVEPVSGDTMKQGSGRESPADSLRLTEQRWPHAISELIELDPDMAGIVARWGIPPFWAHPDGFPGLTLAILGQQVSVESAAATYGKLESRVGDVTPTSFLQVDSDGLRKMGFSRQKATYVRRIAEDMLTGVLDVDSLASMSDEKASAQLMQLHGVGRWTAYTYLLFSLRRRDVWPSGDLALERAVSELRKLHSKLGTDEVDEIAKSWMPLRAVAARVLWHQYLGQRGRG